MPDAKEMDVLPRDLTVQECREFLYYCQNEIVRHERNNHTPASQKWKGSTVIQTFKGILSLACARGVA
ncbi:hypothetical protein [Metabacillus herbersteinensis]|uniref:hypothetical protein n=1 Tax=Metabacillus herbersteinensis TaxID=283816 RepID=UPI00366ACD5B